MSNIDKRETDLLIENGMLVADTLRHLADNEIDSDRFAICQTNENGTEIECELAITDYARQAAGTVEDLVKTLEAAERRIANNERVMRAVVEAASIRGIRPFEGIECDPPTLEENAEACGDAMSARIRELEANPPKPHHNGLMQISNELVQARQRIAELENSETQLINERDAAESALADMYQAATGERPEWSNMFGFVDAVDVVEERLATLEANQSQTTPTGIQLITEAIGAHGYIVGCLLQGRPDLALEESRKWVSAFGQAAEIVSAQDAAGIKVKES
ncbi:hypothetical protein [Salmonella enterica]|uniref:hypothetical protein n=1 Tax=Salmonella enterica TaxID=28901 RepID=UPI0021BD03D0|nr:hypothetical protein [Salmonella enterica]